MNESWRERWQKGRIGWHEPEGNRSLQRHWCGSGLKILVPLCGKSVDMLWLAKQGNKVTGIEVSEIAIREFLDENRLEYRQSADGSRFEAQGPAITLVCRDYLDFDDCRFDAHYDRGALVAMPPEHRAAYAAHTGSLLCEDPVQLVITVEYDQQVVDGPPYSVMPDEVLSYWPQLKRIDAYDDIDNCPPKFRDKGLTEMIEAVWRRG